MDAYKALPTINSTRRSRSTKRSLDLAMVSCVPVVAWIAHNYLAPLVSGEPMSEFRPLASKEPPSEVTKIRKQLAAFLQQRTPKEGKSGVRNAASMPSTITMASRST